MVEFEYIALLDTTKEVVLIKKFVIELRVVLSIVDPIDVYCNNNVVIALDVESRSYQRSKHILIRFQLNREIIEYRDV